MANSLHLSREVEVYVKYDTDYWKVPVLDGFSFSQSTNTAEVAVKEMANASNVSRRGRLMFNDSMAPAEWSFSTYARPFKRTVGDTAEHHMVEEVMWAMLNQTPHDAYNSTTNKFTQADSIEQGDGGAKVKFNKSNVLTAPTATIWFKFPGNDAADGGNTDIWYELGDATVNECAAEFDIDGITTLNWSGSAKSLSEAAGSTVTAIGSATMEVTDVEIQNTGSFIRNRLTQLTVASAMGGDIQGSYNLVLTGGSITITNNVEYVTPASLGQVNKPLGHTLGGRTVSGSFTCYLDHNAGSSADLIEDLLGSQGAVKNKFALLFQVGGSSSTPRVEFDMDQCHLEVPSHNVEDVVGVEVNFHALPTDIGATDELEVLYIGA